MLKRRGYLVFKPTRQGGLFRYFSSSVFFSAPKRNCIAKPNDTLHRIKLSKSTFTSTTTSSKAVMKRTRSASSQKKGDEVSSPSGGDQQPPPLVRSMSSFSADVSGADGVTEHCIAHQCLAPLVAAAAGEKKKSEEEGSPSPVVLPLANGYFVIGCDEAGRGPLAGPVVASACCVYVPPAQQQQAAPKPHSSFLAGLTDSKVVQEDVREALMERLIALISGGPTASCPATPAVMEGGGGGDSSGLRERLSSYYKSGGVGLLPEPTTAAWHFQREPEVAPVDSDEGQGSAGAEEDSAKPTKTRAKKARAEKSATDGKDSSSKKKIGCVAGGTGPNTNDRLPQHKDICVFSDPTTVAAPAILPSPPQLVAFASCIVTPGAIDAVNILHASLHGMMMGAGEILEKLPSWWEAREKAACGVHRPPMPPVMVLVDGTQLPLEVLWGGKWDHHRVVSGSAADNICVNAGEADGDGKIEEPPNEAGESSVPAGRGRGRGGRGSAAAAKKKAPKVKPPPPTAFDRRLKANPHLVPNATVTETLRRYYIPPSAFTVANSANGVGNNTDEASPSSRSSSSVSDRLSELKAWRAENNAAAKKNTALAGLEGGNVMIAAEGKGSGSDSSEVVSSFSYAKTPLIALPVIKGDSLSPAIAAASILSKQLRDHFMLKVLDPLYPSYRFALHKGYPVPVHLEGLRRHGAVPNVHRTSFGPVRDALMGGDGDAE